MPYIKYLCDLLFRGNDEMACTLCCVVKAINSIVFKVMFLRLNRLFFPILLTNNNTFSEFHMVLRFEMDESTLKPPFINHVTVSCCSNGLPSVFITVDKAPLLLLSAPYVHLFFRFSARSSSSYLEMVPGD